MSNVNIFNSLNDKDPLVSGNLHDISPEMINIPCRELIRDFKINFTAFGSCFAEHTIGALNSVGFESYYNRSNCFHYTSKSFLQLLKTWISEDCYTEKDVIKVNNIKNSYVSLLNNYLCEYGDDSLKNILLRMESLKCEAIDNILKSDIIILTLGSATYLKHTSTGKVICSGSGISSDLYEICYSSEIEIFKELSEIYEIISTLKQRNFYFIVTISPQRYSWGDRTFHSHCGDGFYSYFEMDRLVHNNLDKAKLRLGVDAFMRFYQNRRIEYFPSYDLVMDELRSNEQFRFNHNDHLHVSIPHTPNYVINRFMQAHCSADMKKVLSWYRVQAYAVSQRIELLRWGNRFEIEKFIDTISLPEDNPLFRHALMNLSRYLDVLGHGEYAKRLIKDFQDNESTNACKDDSEEFWQVLRALDFYLIQNKGKKIAVFGAGRHTDILMKYSQLSLANIIGFFSTDCDCVKTIYGRKLFPLSHLENVSADIVIVSSISQRKKMINALARLQIVSEVKDIYSGFDFEKSLAGYSAINL